MGTQERGDGRTEGDGEDRTLNAEGPREVDGLCSRCGGKWPCLRCLTRTPPFVPVRNNF